MTEEDGRALRTALGRFATGVAVITVATPGGPLGITANSFASVSLDPPLVLWSPAKASRRFRPFVEADHFAIHVMGAEQGDLAGRFVREGNPFGDLTWKSDPEGTPLIDGCLARFRCRRAAVHDAGDHVIVIGDVLAASHRDGAPLVFAAGRYGGFASSD
ncbi:flavin reductase family protein [Palleronia aestuarii]|nr:flavin reductase family protein [Palleronia aestuarii]